MKIMQKTENKRYVVIPLNEETSNLVQILMFMETYLKGLKVTYNPTNDIGNFLQTEGKGT